MGERKQCFRTFYPFTSEMANQGDPTLVISTILSGHLIGRSIRLRQGHWLTRKAVGFVETRTDFCSEHCGTSWTTQLHDWIVTKICWLANRKTLSEFEVTPNSELQRRLLYHSLTQLPFFTLKSRLFGKHQFQSIIMCCAGQIIQSQCIKSNLFDCV